MRVVVTVDTEADGQWRHGAPLATDNVDWWRPFQDVCERHEVAATWLVTGEIAADPRAAAFLKPLLDRGAAEIGAHLHPWTTPPYRDEPGLTWNDAAHAYPSHLEDELLEEKLTALTAQVGEVFGAAPVSFRAGRFGLDARVARLLDRLGYVIDSSVTPLLSWRDNPGRPGWGGGPDFRGHNGYPFRVEGTGLVELPVTVLATYPLTRRSRLMRDHWQSRPLRAARRALQVGRRDQPLWLRPRPEYAADDLEVLLAEAERRRLPFAVLMFHSSELMPGGSPYRPTEASVAQLLALFDRVFAFARSRGHSFCTLGAAGRELAVFARLPEKPL